MSNVFSNINKKFNWFQLQYKEKEEIPVSLRDVNAFEYIVGFLRETTLQGFPAVVKQTGVIRKLFWLACIALSIYALQWELDTFLSKFLRFQPATLVTVQTPRQLDFPAITVCNNNPINRQWYVSSVSGSKTLSQQGQQKDGQRNTATIVNGAVNGANPAIAGGATVAPVALSATVGSFMGTAAIGVSGIVGGSVAVPGGRKRRDAISASQLSQSIGDVVHSASSMSTGTNGVNPQQAFTPVNSQIANMYAIMEEASALSYSNRSVAGHALCDCILQCTYNGVDCDVSTKMSSWFWSPQYGNCWTFNSGYRKVESPIYLEDPTTNAWNIKRGGTDSSSSNGVLKATQTGSTYGLRLILHADAAHYMYITPQLGWKVLIHNQTEMPFPDEAGYYVMPGTSTHIGIKMSYSKRLGVVSNGLYTANYSSCIEANQLENDAKNNVFSNLLEVAYTPAACLKTCYQYQVMKKCKCYDFAYPNAGGAFNSIDNAKSLPACSYSNSTYWNCKTGVWQSFVENKLPCNCPDTCLTYSYDASVSMLKWPSNDSIGLRLTCSTIYSQLMDMISGNSSNCSSTSLIAEEYKRSGSYDLLTSLKACADGDSSSSIDTSINTLGNNFAELFIYFSDFKHQAIVEYELVEVGDLIAYLGGILGLFFGFSMLTLCEYILLAVDLIVIAVAKIKYRFTADAKVHSSTVCLKTADESFPEELTNQIRGSYHSEHSKSISLCGTTYAELVGLRKPSMPLAPQKSARF